MKTSDPSSATMPPLWQGLTPGAYSCGFKSLWKLDYGRTYQRRAENDSVPESPAKSPRPILINLWYPTNHNNTNTPRNDTNTPMAYGDYLNIATDDPLIASFSQELQKYASQQRAHYTLPMWPPKEIADWTPEEKQAFEQLLQVPTGAYRDAAAAEGQFPLILFHAGYGSPFEANSVMCEFLVSHGYVVIGSAFQQMDGCSFSIESRGATAGDIPFLINFAHGLPFVDWNHIGMIGHSGGAHVAIEYQTVPGCAVDATVSLDTTEDYHGLDMPGWGGMRSAVKKARANLSRPILFAANPEAGFEMVDSMTSTPRYLFTTDSLGHDGFVSVQSLGYWAQLKAASDAERPEIQDEANRAWNRFQTLCETVLHFLDSTLKNDPDALNAQLAQHRDQGFCGDGPFLDYVPPGADSPKPYLEPDAYGPSPRQLRHLLQTQGAEALLNALNDDWRVPTHSVARRTRICPYPAYHDRFIFLLLYRLLARGEITAAQALFNRFGQWTSEKGWPEQFLALNFLSMGKHFRSRTALDYLLILDPENQEAIQELSHMDAPKSSAA
ncbi:hypothetical protein [Armatimonas sp.]|uniref:hypothetical protein n=1 Tax=Armatimonas sp. TaxID=1872638 RepID=UPI00286C2219|nr:hypothetical protein [Armatimonas sp.]